MFGNHGKCESFDSIFRLNCLDKSVSKCLLDIQPDKIAMMKTVKKIEVRELGLGSVLTMNQALMSDRAILTQ